VAVESTRTRPRWLTNARFFFGRKGDHFEEGRELARQVLANAKPRFLEYFSANWDDFVA
jgi:hypothetical protein